jgi:hypothetical protein
MTVIGAVVEATETAAKKQQSTKSCSGKSGNDGSGRGKRREAARAARAASIHKKMQTCAGLMFVTRMITQRNSTTDSTKNSTGKLLQNRDSFRRFPVLFEVLFVVLEIVPEIVPK